MIMSSKSIIRKSTVTHSESIGTSSPSGGRGRSERKTERKSFRSEGGASPTRIRRAAEKEELQSLNIRLAAYIDTVTRLQNENNQLRFQVEKHEETRTKEVISVKSLYEHELDKVRKVLDDVSKEKNQLQLTVDKLEEDVKDLLSKKNKLELLLRGKTKALQDAEAKLADVSPKLEDALSRNKALADENRDLRLENDGLIKRLAESQRKLEAETLARADLQNQLLTAQEQQEFRQQEYETQIREVQSRKTVEISEIDGKVRDMHDEYEKKIQEAVQNLREEHESNLRESLNEMQDRYEDRIEELSKFKANTENDHYRLRQDLISSRTSSETLRNRMSELEALNLELQNKVRELEKRLEEEMISHLDAISIRDDEIKRLNEINEENNAELNELMAIKLSLDAELATYRKMLEGEERRLNITPGGTPGPSRSTPLRGRAVKRKRTLLESSEEREAHQMQTTSSASQSIEICEDDMDGKMIKLHNKGDEDVPLIGYVLKRTVGDEVVSFKFGRNAAAKSGSDLRVWSSGSDVTASAENIIMRNKAWIVGETITTVLSNKEGQEIARRDSSSKHESQTFLIESSGRASSSRGGVELHHQQGDPANRDQCVVM